MVDPTKEWKTRPDLIVACLDCGWKCYARNGHGLGAQHARRYSHTVRVEKATVYIYEHGSPYR